MNSFWAGDRDILWWETCIYGGKQRNEKEQKDSFGIYEKDSFWGWFKLKEYQKGFLPKRKESGGIQKESFWSGFELKERQKECTT